MFRTIRKIKQGGGLGRGRRIALFNKVQSLTDMVTSKRDLREMREGIQVHATSRIKGLEVRKHLAVLGITRWPVWLAQTEWGKSSRRCCLRGVGPDPTRYWASKCGPSPSPLPLPASASPGNLQEMQIIGPRPRPTESETLGMGSSRLCLNKPSS